MTEISTTSKNSRFAIEVNSEDEFNILGDLQAWATGSITIGAFTEHFRMDLSFWGTSDYRRNWSLALWRLMEGDIAVSCLVSSMTDPGNSNFISCWPLYRSGEDIYVQNSIILLDELDGGFDPDNPWNSVQKHSVVDEDGNSISEWVTTVAEVRAFLALSDH